MYILGFRACQLLRSLDDYDGQMIFGDLWGLKLPDNCLTGEEKPEKTSPRKRPDRGSDPGPLRDRRACYRLPHNGGQTPIQFLFLLIVNSPDFPLTFDILL